MILNKRKVRGKDKFLVRWKEFTAEGDTWESRENLQNAGDLLREFEEEYGDGDDNDKLVKYRGVSFYQRQG